MIAAQLSNLRMLFIVRIPGLAAIVILTLTSQTLYFTSAQ